MNFVTEVLIGLIIILHLYFLWLEMFAWTTKARKVFRNFHPDLFEPTKTMAANQGLYNGFLAAGLLWTFFIEDSQWRFYIAVFFLTCILIAGCYGAYSISKKIFFVQALPALIALILLHIG